MHPSKPQPFAISLNLDDTPLHLAKVECYHHGIIYLVQLKIENTVDKLRCYIKILNI